MNLPLKEVTLVILGGLFGWSLGKLPDKWVYLVMAVAIILVLLVIKK